MFVINFIVFRLFITYSPSSTIPFIPVSFSYICLCLKTHSISVIHFFIIFIIYKFSYNVFFVFFNYLWISIFMPVSKILLYINGWLFHNSLLHFTPEFLLIIKFYSCEVFLFLIHIFFWFFYFLLFCCFILYNIIYMAVVLL